MDVLAIGAHPDDVELAAGGTLCLLVRQGYSVGILDLTRGELGSRGTTAGRAREAAEAARILGVAQRTQLGLADGNIAGSPDAQLRVIRALRGIRPRLVMTHPDTCRHADHTDAARLVTRACFYSGLRKIDTGQEPWRPQHVLHFEEVLPFSPMIIVDVTATWEQRMEAMQSYASQFYNAAYTSDEPETFVSNKGFVEWIEARARVHGHVIGATYGEAFQSTSPIGVRDLMGIMQSEKAFR